jgi:hypothetical protein
MRKILAVVVLVFVVGVAGVFAFLASVDLPPPEGAIEMPIPNDRFEQ